VLRLIALERSVRALILIAVGIVLMTHVHTDWGRAVTHFARHFGLDTSRQGVHRLLRGLSLLSARRIFTYGLIATAYGVLEGVEGYGLWRHRRWGEYLTVIATSLLFIPEVWELVKRASALKGAALAVNVAIVAYLIVRLRRSAASPLPAKAAAWRY
jgi:uncharacterized membrane protein (DUF2068 family)